MIGGSLEQLKRFSCVLVTTSRGTSAAIIILLLVGLKAVSAVSRWVRIAAIRTGSGSNVFQSSPITLNEIPSALTHYFVFWFTPNYYHRFVFTLSLMTCKLTRLRQLSKACSWISRCRFNSSRATRFPAEARYYTGASEYRGPLRSGSDHTLLSEVLLARCRRDLSLFVR